jgi:hypothetical protein
MDHIHLACCFSIQLLAVTYMYSEYCILKLVCKHAMLSMLLVVVLQELAELSEEFVAGSTVIGIIGSPGVVATIGQKGRARQVGPHGRLGLSKFVNVIASIVLATTASAISTLHVLHCIGTRSESYVATHWTSYVARTMDLRMHLQLIGVGENEATFRTLKSSMDTKIATRGAFSLTPLIAGILAALAPIVT